MRRARDLCLVGGRFGVVQGDLGGIEGGDLLAALSEPDGVATLAATDVQDRPGDEVDDLRDQRAVQEMRPDRRVLMSRLESGKRRLAIDHLPALAGALGVSVDELLRPEVP